MIRLKHVMKISTRLKSNAGFSIIEALIGAAILATVSVSVVYLVVGTQGNGTTQAPASNEACRVLANRTIDIVREKGNALTYSNYLKATPTYCNSTDCLTETTPATLNSAYKQKRWDKPILVPGVPWTVNTEMLVVGYMNYLNTIVSTTPGICSSPNGPTNSAHTNNFLSDSIRELKTNDAYLNELTATVATFIQTYDLATGTIIGNCSNGFRIAPPQPPMPSTNFLTEQKLFSKSEYDNATRDKGYLVTAKVTMRLPGETTDRSCLVSQKFAYDGATLNQQNGKLTITTTNSSLLPLVPTVSAAADIPVTAPNNYSGSNGRMGANILEKFTAGSVSTIPGPNAGTGSVRAVIRTARADSVLLCRDRSRARLPLLSTYTPPVSIPNGKTFSNVSMISVAPSAPSWQNEYKRVVKKYQTPPILPPPVINKVDCSPGICTHLPPFFDSGVANNIWDLYSGGPASIKPVLPEKTPEDYDNSTLLSETARWEPCEIVVNNYNANLGGRISTCRELGGAASLFVTAIPGQPDVVTLDFSRLREGCDVAIDVVEVGSNYSPTPIDLTFGYNTINEYILERDTNICYTEATGGNFAGVPITPYSYFFSDNGCGASPNFKNYDEWHQ